jgi:hypothetical protein
MANNIYTVEDFEERLSELTIGTEDVQKLIAFVQMRERTIKGLIRKINMAESIIGEYELDRRLMEGDYE